ncbi:ankyrin repeat and SOCS box containing 18 [Rhinolophus ferrumequinum]|uniref:Ankyrin repeat and SOCS box containing 18 n=1 Tax=Rhinolophus ferrumequinum TaxID=59479 RepID=A0A671DXN9_RHIFE|nr:ankyrin repeat and SOCS box protein 18 [Rhinolophus ferrumequinum]KAF6361064.1 ankyrin repeat and SOCS box containing 18 [Rhinolophus ferrumequinum]
MSSSDRCPDYPLSSDLATRLKSALDAKDEERVRNLLCTEVTHVDAVIELANDDWMKDPSAQLPPAVLLGDLQRLEPLLDQFFQDTNVVFEITKEQMEWQVKSPATFGLSGLWTLEYKRELTTPLGIAAARGHTDCLHHLLSRGADPDASPGGRGPLHEACLGGHTACAQLLLQHGAHPDLLSAEGLAPLHLCRTVASLGCAQALLKHGASVHRTGGTDRDTPLHVAAQRGLDEHTSLYLGRGARVDARNRRGETALSTACGAARRPDEYARCLRLCALLLQHGAAADARDEDERSPLHKACGHAPPGLARLLLQHGANPAALDYGGASPLGRVLQTAACLAQAAPQHAVRELLNHGSPTVWPDAFLKVLKTCAPAPAVIEVLFNSYPQLRVSESWKEVIPEEVFQMHRTFYQSLFAVAHGPRCLQHLCRCAIRKWFGKKCFHLVPLLPLPKSLQNYLLLEPEGVLH